MSIRELLLQDGHENEICALMEQLPEGNQEIIKQIHFQKLSVEAIANQHHCMPEDVLKMYDVTLKKLEELYQQ